MVSEESKRVEEMNYFELLAWLGIGSSHPGGFPTTLQNLNIIQAKSEEYLLEAGCGSGLTACHLAKTVGCKIIGVDNNPQMIEKARLRAEKEGVSQLVEFHLADVYSLPFADNSFDLVIAESLTVFLDKVKVYREFYRVLKPEGRVADLEMALLTELPNDLRKELIDCFGASTNPLTFEGWLDALAQVGFQNQSILNPQPLMNRGNLVVNELKKDWILLKDLALKIKNQPGLIARLQRNAGFIKKNREYFGFGLVYGQKPIPLPKRLNFKEWLKKVLSIRKTPSL